MAVKIESARLSVTFSVVQPDGTNYTDAVTVPLDISSWPPPIKATVKAIRDQAQIQADNYRNTIAAPPPVPTRAEKRAQLESLKLQRADIDTQITTLEQELK